MTWRAVIALGIIGAAADRGVHYTPSPYFGVVIGVALGLAFFVGALTGERH